MRSSIATDLPTGFAAQATRWVLIRLAAYFGAAIISGALFLAGATVYGLVASKPIARSELPKIIKPESTPTPILLQRSPPPAQSDPTPVPMASASPEHGPKAWVPDAKVSLAGGAVVPASELYQKTVYSPDNSSLGEVVGFVVSPTGKVSSVILTLGGFLGTREIQVAVPVQSLMLKKGSESGLTAEVTKDSLKAMPEFKYDSTKGWEPLH
jgi:hypothetical protein